MLEILFIITVVIIWAMIAFNFILTMGGYAYWRKFFSFPPRYVTDNELPCVSAMVPARNEEMVIEKTVRSLLAMDYPYEKLEIIVINDKSTDRTAEIVGRLAQEDPRVRLLSWPAAERGSGKPRALNEGLQLCRHPIIAIYDGDNNPHVASLRILCSHLVRNPSLTAVLGKFRCLNRNKNVLTRMVNIETIGFQWMIQAGRYFFSKFAVLPGTNYIIRKEALAEVGGWDIKAITEDSELSVRLQEKGYQVQFVPTSVTWEQEPETIRAWVKQRTRWVRGNNYVMAKFARRALHGGSWRLTAELFYLFGLYYLFLFSTVASHVLFLLGLFGIAALHLPGPYTAVWMSAFVLFCVELFFVLSYEREDTPANLATTVLMYFTYGQLWIYVVFKGLWFDLTRSRVGEWDKTERYKVQDEAASPPQLNPQEL